MQTPKEEAYAGNAKLSIPGSPYRLIRDASMASRDVRNSALFLESKTLGLVDALVLLLVLRRPYEQPDPLADVGQLRFRGSRGHLHRPPLQWEPHEAGIAPVEALIVAADRGRRVERRLRARLVLGVVAHVRLADEALHHEVDDVAHCCCWRFCGFVVVERRWVVFLLVGRCSGEDVCVGLMGGLWG